MQYWLVKQEPEDYSWDDFVRDGSTAWTGVRNYAARNHLKAMQRGDTVFFYHSGDEKRIVGLAQVKRSAFPDPTADSPDEGWVAVELVPQDPLPSPVTLAQVKAEAALKGMALVRISRLSVQPVTSAEATRLRKLGGA